MRVLVSGHGYERVPLDTARRTVPYDKLVLLTTTPGSRDLEALKENEALAGVTVETHAVDADDLTGTLATANKALEQNARGSLAVHVAGGPNLVTSALLLAAFQRGVTAFFCHERRVSELPVIRAASFVERFNETDRNILLALSAKKAKTHEEITPRGATLDSTRGALRRLRANGLVIADVKTASLTPTGEYYRAHFEATRRQK